MLYENEEVFPKDRKQHPDEKEQAASTGKD
jgi:hypothetical protein